jgi:hypothetical protein
MNYADLTNEDFAVFKKAIADRTVKTVTLQ